MYSFSQAMFYSDQLLRKMSDSAQAVTIQELHAASKPRLPTPITPLVTSKTIANKVF